MKAKRILRKIFKVFAWIIGIFIFLLLLVYILIQVPGVQNFAKGKVVSYIQNKIKTRVEIGKLSLDFPKRLVLENVYFEDQKKDTLLYGGKLRVDISLFKLLSNEVNIQYIELDSIKAHIYRVDPDTSFNFDYIVKAFSTEQQATTPVDTTSLLKFNVGRIVLKDILATFKDDETGSDVYFYLGNLETSIKTFDPYKLIFNVPEIAVSNIITRIYQYKPLIKNKDSLAPVPSPASSAYNPQLEIESISSKQLLFDYKNDVSAISANLTIGDFNTHPDNIDLQNLAVSLKDLTLNNTVTKVTLGKSQEAKATKDVAAAKTDSQLNNPWKFQLAKANFNNDELHYDDNNAPPLKEGFDPSHVHVTNFTFNGDSLNFTPAVFSGNINQLAFKEGSGLNLKKFHTKFYYSDTGAAFTDLLLQTDATLLQNHVIVKYPSIEAASKRMGDIYVDVDLMNSHIAVKDIIAFMPSYKRNLQSNQWSVIKLNASAKGYLKDLSIPVLEISGFGNTYLKLSAKLQGLPDTKRAYYNVTINQFSSTKKDLLSVIPPKSIPSNVNLPDNLSLTGSFKGSMTAFATKLALKTNRGNVNVDATMKSGNVYTVKANLQNVDGGYLMKQQQNIGIVTANITASGSGFDVKKANAKYSLEVISAQVKGYTYKNLIANGTLDNGVNKTTASIHDPNISLALDVTADLKSTYPPLQLDLQIDTLNARALNLTTDTLSISGHVIADLPSTNPDDLVGTVKITDLELTTAGQQLSTDSLSLVASGTPQEKSIVIQSDALDANLTGQYKLTEMAQAIMQTINRYYALPGYQQKNIAPENWQLNANIRAQGLVLQLAPSLQGSDSIVVKAHLNTAANDLGMTVQSQKLVASGYEIDSLNTTVQTGANTLNADVSIQGAKGSSFQLYKTAFTASVANSQLDFNLDSKDQKNTTQYAIGGLLSGVGSGFKVSIKPNLTLDYSNWNVASGNSVEYDSTGVIVTNLSLSQGTQSITVNSTSPSVHAPISIDLKNFEISTITKLAHQDSLLASGTINGHAEITNPTSDMVFTSDIKVTNLVYKLDTIGNLEVKVNNKTANAYNADVTLTGNNNDVHLTGMYYTGEGRMDLNLAINSINLAIVKPFATGQLDDITGILKGNVSIKGTTADPQVEGNFNFENASLVPTISGERFRIPNDAVNINSQGVHFNQFTLLDSAGNKAVLDGDILTSDFKTYSFDLTLNAENFTVVDAPQQTNRMMYGKLNITTDVQITGEMTSPTVTANLFVNKTTDFAFILPQTDPEVVSRQGVVNFVDKDNPVDSADFHYAVDSLAVPTKLSGVDINLNIETDSTAKFTIVVDERSGDALTLKGRARLNGGIDKSGKLTLTGNYELSSGSYTVSLSILKKQFLIQQGSTITWTGDPTAANIDLTATYLANTAPIDLMQSSLAGRSAEDLTRYKQKLPFNVLLHMTGELLKPVIKFDITLPPREATQWPDVETKLEQVRADESELNKQVFALLLLGRFVQENPFASAAGGSTENQLRGSASRILTDQLNQLAGSLIKGVDINFGITSGTDYSTGQEANKTDLNVTVSKKLLNDRLRVSVGSDFELEGPSTGNQSSSNPAGNVAVDYQLSKDGRYLIRIYRMNEYEGVLEGQVVETGASFILVFDYDKISELFKGRKEARRIRKYNKQVTKQQQEAEQQMKKEQGTQTTTPNP